MPRTLSIPPALLTACATGSTLRSGVGDRLLEHPPYYASGSQTSTTGRPGHLPIAYQRGVTQLEMFDPDSAPGARIALLQREMTRYLDSLGMTTRLVASGVAAAGTPPGRALQLRIRPGG